MACFVAFQDDTDLSDSGGISSQDHDHHMAADGVEPSDHRSPEVDTKGADTVHDTHLAQDIVNDSVPDLLEDDPEPEHNIDEVIASLESQVDHLCSLLDNFRSDFRASMNAFRTTIRNLPEQVGTDYNARQRAYLLHRYGQSIEEASELSLQRLNHDLSHLIALGDDGHLYEAYASTSSSLLSSLQLPSPPSSIATSHSTDPVSDEEFAMPISSQTSEIASRPQLTSPRQHLDSPDLEAVVDSTTERLSDHGDLQHASAEAQEEPVRRRREVIIDWVRFHGENCREDIDIAECAWCIGWRRGFEEAAWE